MLELYEVTGDEDLLRAAEQAIFYLAGTARPCGDNGGQLLCIVEDGEVKLGGNGLASIALAKYMQVTGKRDQMATLLGLGRWIRSVQAVNGEFTIHKQTHPEATRLDFVSQFYPGEAILALARIYALDPDEAWLNAAQAGARYLIQERDGNLAPANRPHDHWLLFSLDELYRMNPDPLYLEHALALSDAIMASQNRTADYPDWVGGYFQPPDSTSTATRTEGLAAVYRLARDFDHLEEASAIHEAIQLGVQFELQAQYQPESVMFFPNPRYAIGGIPGSFSNLSVRIDYVQHAIASILNLYEIEQAGA